MEGFIMAYKFQLGDAKLGGAVESTGIIKGADADFAAVLDSTVASIITQMDAAQLPGAKIANNGITNLQMADDSVGAAEFIDNSVGAAAMADDAIETAFIVDDAVTAAKLASNAVVDASVAANAAIAHTKLAGIAAASILMGNASGVATATAVSGELTLANNGGLSINANAVTNAKMADNSVGAAELIDNSVGAAAMAADAIETAFIADDQVTYAKVQNVSATARILGRNTSGAGVIEEVTPAQLMGMFNSDLGGNFIIGNQASDSATFTGAIVVGGDLTVNGTTTTVNSTTVQIDDLNLQLADGAAAATAVNGGGITLAHADAGDDFTFAYNHASTAWKSSIDMDLLSGKGFKINGASILTATALNPTVKVDGDSLLIASCTDSLNAAGIDLANDFFVVSDGNASGVAKKMTGQDLRQAMQNQARHLPGAAVIITSNLTVSNEISLVDTSAARTLTMPDITDGDLGKVYVIKDATGSGAGTNAITLLDSTSGHALDGVVSMTLESDRVAISLVACKNGATFFYSVY
jgi:hypothetical protein